MTLELANKMYSRYILDDRYLNKQRIIDDVIINLEDSFYGYTNDDSCRYCNCSLGCSIMNNFTIEGYDSLVLVKRQDINILFKTLSKKLSDTNCIILSYLVKDTCKYC